MIDNKSLRKIWLKQMLLGSAPSSKLSAYDFINQLGFVQIDSIPNVMRAQYHILWSRNNQFRAHMLDDLLSSRSLIFEHFTHDASLIDNEIYPYWKLQFERFRAKISQKGYYSNLPDQEDLNAILQMIEEKGAMSVSDFPKMGENSKHAWSRPAHKTGLDFLWYCGDLSTSHRINFKKYYDLKERIVPHSYRDQNKSESEQIDYLCRFAIGRLGVATPMQIAEFWGVLNQNEVKAWVKEQEIDQVEVELNDKKIIPMLKSPDLDIVEDSDKFTSSMFLLNPFDPAIRDRKRLLQYFGFEYKNEIFVPKEKRKYGYYVYPILYKGQFIGRIELTANRKTAELELVNLWWEHSKFESKTLVQKLNAHLAKFARFADLKMGFEIKYGHSRSGR